MDDRRLTAAEKLAEFRALAKKAEKEQQAAADPWTLDDIRDAANRIAERMGINEQW